MLGYVQCLNFHQIYIHCSNLTLFYLLIGLHLPDKCKLDVEIKAIYSSIQELWLRVKDLKSLSTSKQNSYLDELGNRHFSEYSRVLDTIGNKFLSKIRKEVNNCGAVNSIAFLQMISLTGLIPPEIVAWSSVAHTQSGGYKLMKYLNPRGEQLTCSDAQYNIWEAKNEIEYVFGSFISLAFIENWSCEWLRDIKTKKGISNAKDVFFRTKHHRCQQSFFRCKQKSNHSLSIEMMPGDLDNNYVKNIKCNEDQFKKTTSQEVMLLKSKKSTTQTSTKEHLIYYSSYNEKTDLPRLFSYLKVHGEILRHYYVSYP